MSIKLLAQNLRKEWLNSRVEISAVDGEIYIPKAEVTQTGSSVTQVTCNGIMGQITTVNLTDGAGLNSEFAVLNSFVEADSVVIAQIVDYSGTYATDGFPTVTVDGIGAGFFTVNIMNTHHSTALSGVVKVQFIVLKVL